jgi:mannose-6-phosphate isomerase-like protein (cupin superfamily)
MKKIKLILPIAFFIITGMNFAQAQSTPVKSDPTKFVFESDDQVRKEAPGPHQGGGESIGYSFFDNAPGYHTAFKKRVLKPGSSIGYHMQKEDEVYYIIEGKGEMKINGEIYPVKPGDAILTRTGSSHGITPLEGTELVIIIVYEKHKK